MECASLRYHDALMWDTQCRFTSREEIMDHWRWLLNSRESRSGSFPLPLGSKKLDMFYEPQQGWKYYVTLAAPEDGGALSALSDEFAMAHSSIFNEYKVDHRVWLKYLGLRTDNLKRVKAASDEARRNLAAASRGVNYQSICHKGCTLKCEAMPDNGESTFEPSSSSRGPVVRNGKLFNGDRARGDGIVGYVHFTLEEGRSEKEPRFSKRLRQKRGGATSEYIKISHIIVTRPHQKSGIGTLLLTAVMHRVSCLDPTYAREIFLTVIKRNQLAIRLYKDCGLSPIGENTTYLGNDKSRPVVWYQMSTKVQLQHSNGSGGSSKAAVGNGSSKIAVENGSSKTADGNGSSKTGIENGSSKTAMQNGLSKPAVENGSSKTTQENGLSQEEEDEKRSRWVSVENIAKRARTSDVD